MKNVNMIESGGNFVDYMVKDDKGLLPYFNVKLTPLIAKLLPSFEIIAMPSISQRKLSVAYSSTSFRQIIGNIFSKLMRMGLSPGRFKTSAPLLIPSGTKL